MDEDDLAQLVVQMTANYNDLQKDLQKAEKVFKDSCDKIVQQQIQTNSKLAKGFSGIADGFKKSLAAIGGIELFRGLIDGSHALADSTLNTSKALGYSAENLQGWGILARRAGVDQGTLNDSLSHFTAAVGQAQLKTTPFSQVMSKLGVDIRHGPEQALLDLSDKLAALPKAQQAAVAKMALGGGGIANLGWLTQGSKGIAQAVAQFEKLGMVLPTDKLEKINQLFDAWQDIKTEALVGFMNGFAGFAGEIETPQFQQSIQTFGQVMGEVSGAIVKMAPYLPLLIEAFVAFRSAKGGAMLGGEIGSFFGPGGAAVGIGVGGLLGGIAGFATSKHVMDGLIGQGGVPEAGKTAPPAAGGGIGGVLDADAAKRAAARIAALNRSLDQDVAASAAKGQDAYGDMVKATLDAAPDAAKGTAAYYGMLQAQITQTAALDIDKINQRKDADIAAIASRRDADLAALDALKVSEQQKADERAKIEAASEQQLVNVAAAAADQIETINIQKNQKLLAADWRYQQQLQNNIDLTNNLRQGMENVAVAGLHGFKSMKDAAADFLDQLAQTIMKLYVMQPLLDSLFGQSGTAGGGLLGGAISGASHWLSDGITSFFGFADGGIMTSRGPIALRKYAGGGVANTPQLALFGEGDGPEAFVPLKDGAIPVNLKIPRLAPIPSAAERLGAPTVVQHFDLSGAVVTDEIVARAERAGATAAATRLQQFNTHVLPGRVRQLVTDPYRGY